VQAATFSTQPSLSKAMKPPAIETFGLKANIVKNMVKPYEGTPTPD
jgi:hypothetical protein